MEFLSVLNTESEIKILIPKARRLIPNKKQHKKKISKNNKQKIGKKANFAEKSINLEDISLDEINNDFKALNEKSEEDLCYNELSNILSSSSDDSLSQKNLKVKRPKKSIHFEDNNILSYFFF